MSNEEAIEWFKNSAFYHKDHEPFNMAIQALSQKPCDDAISREAVLEGLKGCICEEWIKTLFATMVKQLPSVTQKSGKWIEDAITYYEELNKRGLGVDEYTPYFVDDIACSVCLAMYSTIDNETQFFKYCPNCGCRMIEPQESGSDV